MRKVKIPLGENSYNIYIDSGIISNKNLIQSYIKTKQICIISNKVIADLYLDKLKESLKKDDSMTVITVILPEGEKFKNQDTLNLIYDELIKNNFSRDCLLIALGGGIVGDITGFAASSYQRGVDFIQIPTTVLAQVDSSVGGKTGINHKLGKNMIGAFYQPKAVFIDLDVLSTLPQREFSAGMAEVIKYGLIRDEPFLDKLEIDITKAMSGDVETLAEIIEISCQHKSDVVANDEKEKGERATLNLGHTFGHAIETLTEYKRYLHGEAVAIGTIMAAELSKEMSWIDTNDIGKIKKLFEQANCPVSLDNVSFGAKEIREAMQRDKKVLSGKLKLILLNNLGNATIRDDIDEELVSKAIEKVIN